MATDAPEKLRRARRAALLRGIYVILNDSGRTLELARAALDGGVRVLQYRAKAGIDAQRLRGLRAVTRERGALLIVNDDWQAALMFDCDGVHLGPEDDGFASVARVRAALPERLIGLSCGTLEEVRAANAGDVDYVGVGSVYATPSKIDAGEPIGLDGLRRLAGATALPVAAVGGITLATLRDVRNTGAKMAAVISAISGASEPERAARDLVSQWEARTS
jgi:thiamine-phosphate pyrophosphorylase